MSKVYGLGTLKKIVYGMPSAQLQVSLYSDQFISIVGLQKSFETYDLGHNFTFLITKVFSLVLFV